MLFLLEGECMVTDTGMAMVTDTGMDMGMDMGTDMATEDIILMTKKNRGINASSQN